MYRRSLIGALVLALAAFVAITVGSTERGEGQEKSMKWRDLTPEESRVIVHKGTERAFTGRYTDHKADGTYVCKRLRGSAVRV